MPPSPPTPPTDEPSYFSCSWSPVGVAAAVVRVAGEVDMATAPSLTRAAQQAAEHAHLVVLDLQEVSLMDRAGLGAVLDASLRAQEAGRRFVVTQVSQPVEWLLAVTGPLSDLEVVGGADPDPRPADEDRFQRCANPVNARIVAARAMAVTDRRLWLHAEDAHIYHAWTPEDGGDAAAPGRPVELYLDHHGAVNGWRDPISEVAVNQRHLDPVLLPADGVPMACQGRCGLVWVAPAAAQLAGHEEHCLTCAGPLAPG